MESYFRMYPKQKVLIFGGTGSLGKTLLKRLPPDSEITVFSRDEAKHHRIKLDFPHVRSIIGDIRDFDAVARAVWHTQAEVIINAAAMKQVPACEFHPYESIMTNTIGTFNLVKAIETAPALRVSKVLSISTDKACKPVNSYGMTKALQERIHLNGNDPRATFNCVRYGNVLESTGSVIPVFQKLLKEGKDLTITDERMTRFLLSLDQAVDLIFLALAENSGGKIFIPKVKSAGIVDLAYCMIEHAKSDVMIELTGIRPGEKLDEILISEEEVMRTEDRGDVYVIHDIKGNYRFTDITKEYSSGDCLMSCKELDKFLKEHGVI